MKRKAASRQLCNGHCRSLTLPVHNHRTGCKDRLKHNRLQYPQIGISRLRMVIRRGNSRLRRGIGSTKRPGKDVTTTGMRESRRAVCVLSAFPGHVAMQFPRGKKLVACFLKLVARISKSEPLIFSFLPCGVNALNFSFQFFSSKMPFFAHGFSPVEKRFYCVSAIIIKTAGGH